MRLQLIWAFNIDLYLFYCHCQGTSNYKNITLSANKTSLSLKRVRNAIPLRIFVSKLFPFQCISPYRS